MSRQGPSQYDLESRWVTEEGIAGVTYRFSDLVQIRSGEYSGQTGEVIALLAIEPEPIYGITLSPNEKFIVLPQPELERIGSAGRALILRKSNR